MNKHKWHKEIKAWADGAEIEGQWQWAHKDSPASGWRDIESPDWESKSWIYRIKPQPKEPQYAYAWLVKDEERIEFYADKPEGVLNDDWHQYIGKIKLEQDDE